MLSETNGVITEERFQKMTTSQWIFQYKIICKKRKRHDDYFDYLMKQLELVGAMCNPESGKRLQEIREMSEMREDLNEENFIDIMEEVKKNMPQTLVVDMSGGEGDKFFLPKYEQDSDKDKKVRKLGIVKKDGE